MARLLLRVPWRHRLCALAIVGTLGAANCGTPSHPSANLWNVSNSDNGRGLSVAVGDEIDATLQTIGPGEYDERPSVSSPAVMFSKVSFPLFQNPGGPRQLFQFTAVATGHAAISIPHTFQDSRFEITVDVR